MHWVNPKLVAEITYLTWTDGLLRHTVYVGLRQDKPDVGRINVEFGLHPLVLGFASRTIAVYVAIGDFCRSPAASDRMTLRFRNPD